MINRDAGGKKAAPSKFLGAGKSRLRGGKWEIARRKLGLTATSDKLYELRARSIQDQGESRNHLTVSRTHLRRKDKSKDVHVRNRERDNGIRAYKNVSNSIHERYIEEGKGRKRGRETLRRLGEGDSILQTYGRSNKCNGRGERVKV